MVQNAPDGGDAAANQLFAPERCPTGAATGIITNRQQLTCVWLSKILEGSSIKKSRAGWPVQLFETAFTSRTPRRPPSPPVIYIMYKGYS
jgi:hypothetical protein